MSKTSVKCHFEGLIAEANAQSADPNAEHSQNYFDWYASTLQEILDGVEGTIQLSEGEAVILDDALDELFGLYSNTPEKIKDKGLAVLQIAVFIKLCG